MKAKNIMFPVDFSDHFETTYALASSLARETGATLHLVHVVHDVSVPVDVGFTGYMPDTVDVETPREQLDEINDPVDVRVKKEVLIGVPADALIQYVEKHDVDLVVMGTHGRTGLSRLLMGSVAEIMVRKATCPVLTVKQPSAVAVGE